jgi:pimeloyl-ACP methyl ester carboxylesterase
VLRARGVDSVAPTLPMGDASAGALDWARVASAAVDGRTADVVAVAHSLGGMALPLLPRFLPVRRLVLVSATVPQPGLSYADYLQTDEGRDAILMPVTVAQPGEDTRGECTWPVARDYFYSDCDEHLARAAWERLMHRATTVFTEPPTLDEWPDVPTTFVVPREDRCVNPDWSRRSAARLGADVVEIDGGHSPFLSRPAELADLLVGLA